MQISNNIRSVLLVRNCSLFFINCISAYLTGREPGWDQLCKCHDRGHSPEWKPSEEPADRRSWTDPGTAQRRATASVQEQTTGVPGEVPCTCTQLSVLMWSHTRLYCIQYVLVKQYCLAYSETFWRRFWKGYYSVISNLTFGTFMHKKCTNQIILFNFNFIIYSLVDFGGLTV